MTDQTRAAREVELPALDENIVKSVEELTRHMKVQIADIVAVRFLVANNVLCGLEERERQLCAQTVELNRAKELLTWAKQWIPLEGREPVDAFLNPESLKGEKNDGRT